MTSGDIDVRIVNISGQLIADAVSAQWALVGGLTGVSGQYMMAPLADGQQVMLVAIQTS